MSELLDKIAVFEERAAHIEEKLADPEIASQPAEYGKLAKELAGLRPAADVSVHYRKVLAEIEDANAMLNDEDPELQQLARGELDELEARRCVLEDEIRKHLIPRDQNDEKNVILEVRAGTGGDEAALFAMDLLRMYTRYAEKQGWRLEILSSSNTDGGGMKEVIATVTGDQVYSRLKYERGVHRVQRVPATESQGRIHTSTVTVAVLPEAEEVDVHIEPSDLRIDVFRASGPGGQSVNTTDSAVRITHVPTGAVVQCQDEKSQHKNKAKAMKVLRSRLLEHEQQRSADERASARREQVGSGERSEKIRTYNYPQSRVTDHRAGVTLHRLEAIVEGDLDEMLDAVRVHMTAQAVAQEGLA
ncbi:MAG: peptide chain release factor 1 [Myxococcales bacterium]|nr:peptide chain release factor 1 [Myxococcales bacterium]